MKRVLVTGASSYVGARLYYDLREKFDVVGTYHNTRLFDSLVPLDTTDQKALIDFMHNDAEVKPYRFESFTVPFLHSEGWQYLHEYYYPHEESKHAKLIYIAIEKNIPQFWQEKWLEDLGKTEIVFKKQFGQIHLQKRYLQE